MPEENTLKELLYAKHLLAEQSKHVEQFLEAWRLERIQISGFLNWISEAFGNQVNEDYSSQTLAQFINDFVTENELQSSQEVKDLP